VNKEKRKAVLRFLFKEQVNQQLFGNFVVVNIICAKTSAQEKYEELSSKERESIVKKIIINYLVSTFIQSLAFNFVNGSPQKRLFRIKEFAFQKYDSLTEDERILILKKINNN
jgi:hypothetical protein